MSNISQSIVLQAYRRAATAGDKVLYTFYDDHGHESGSLRLGDLLAGAQAIGDTLRSSHRLQIGERVLLCYPPSLEFIRALVGCMSVGLIPVPVYPPAPTKWAADARNLATIAESCDAQLILTSRSYQWARRLANARSLVTGERPRWPDLRWVVTDRLRASRAHLNCLHEASPHDIAFLQYTSGSTSAPKGVEITHDNLRHQLAYNADALGLDRDSRLVMWVPQYHDLGLISGIFSTLSGNGWLGILSPLSFLKRPAVWFEVMHRARATHTAAPNFAYSLAARRTTAEERAGWDLSSLQVAMNAAEPVRADTARAFLTAFASSGLSPEAWCPAYGLAEHTVGVTMNGGRIATADREALQCFGRFVPLAESDDATERIELVSCGAPTADVRVRIVDHAGQVRGPGQVGEIWVDSQSKAKGYAGLDEYSEATFHARLSSESGDFLRTGDLGFLHDGELYVTGRAKDLLIIGGRNIYPHDIEDSVRRCSALIRPGGIAVFSATSEVDEGDGLAILAELVAPKPTSDQQQRAIAAIRRTVREEWALACEVIVLAPPRTVRKTTSGKIRRKACQEAFSNGALSHHSVTFAARDNRPEPVAQRRSQPRPEAGDTTLEMLRQLVAEALGVAAADIDIERPVREQGVSSLQIVEFVETLENRLGRPLSPAIFFESANLVELASALEEQRSQTRAVVPASEPRSESGERDAIAIVGVGCRLPGAIADLDSLWELLRAGRDAIEEVPASRWDVDAWYDPDPDAPGKMNTRWGGFLGDITGFDPEFFRVAPREAEQLDPQGRLLLEVTWRALEHAGLTRERLTGSDTGVYMGLCANEYQSHTMTPLEGVDAYSLLGTLHSAIVGRISYAFDLRGPNLPVDTACSSSLVAVHLACQALRRGECSVALAGGANTILAPEVNVFFSKLRAMSPTGRCHAFSAAADGYVRSEGCGVIVLEPLSAARARGARILAVIRGSAVNQDGLSNGPTAPNGGAQEQVIRSALAAAGVAPASIDYVECHGTGTPLGDPVEVSALKRVFGPSRTSTAPVRIGSIKSNIGHCEGAAGIAGLLKVVAALRHRQLPPSLHAHPGNPHIRWDEIPVRVVDELEDWSIDDHKPRLAGVSSFGLSGTNAHVILEEAPVSPDIKPTHGARTTHALLLSAKTATGLRTSAARHADAIGDIQARELADACASAACRRSHFEHRLAVLGTDPAELATELKRFANGQSSTRDITGRVPASVEGIRPKIAFLFTGQGCQYPGMGAVLYRQEPHFRTALDRISTVLEPHLGASLLEVMHSEDTNDHRLAQTAWTQPAVFAFELAMFELWREFGVAPDIVMGHSVGEIAAAVAAGCLSLEHGAYLVAERARLMQALPGGGSMLAIRARASVVEAELAAHTGHICIAGYNAADSIVVSGDAPAVAELARALKKRGVETRALMVSHAFHSHHMEPMASAFATAIADLEYRAPSVTMIANLTGTLVGTDGLGAAYWVRHTREPVRFTTGLAVLGQQRVSHVIEVGPHPVLLGLLGRDGSPVQSARRLPSARRGHDPATTLFTTLAMLWRDGQKLDWRAIHEPASRRWFELPGHPFERQPYWVERGARERKPTAREDVGPSLPLWRRRVELAHTDDEVFESVWSARALPFVADHRVRGIVVIPGAMLLEAVHSAACSSRPPVDVALTEVALTAPLTLAEGGERSVQLRLTTTDDGEVEFELSSRARAVAGARPWTMHVRGRISTDRGEPVARLPDERERDGYDAEDIDDLYDLSAVVGLDYGPAFRALQWLGTREAQALAHVTIPEEAGEGAVYGLHPVLLDAALQACATLYRSEGRLCLPVSVERYRLLRPGERELWVHVRRDQHRDTGESDIPSCHVRAYDRSGRIVAEIEQLRVADASQLDLVGTHARWDWVYRLDWRELPSLPDRPVTLTEPLVIGYRGDAEPLARAVAAALEAAGIVQVVAGAAAAAEEALARSVDRSVSVPSSRARLLMLWGRESEYTIAGDAEAMCLEAVAQLQSLAEARCDIHWVTVSDSDGASDGALRTSPLWGLARTWQAEGGDMRVIEVADGLASNASAQALIDEILAVHDEPQVTIRRGQRHGARLVRAQSSKGGRLQLHERASFHLAIPDPGRLDRLTLQSVARRSPGAGEVELEVLAAGLNFRDVLSALGMYPGDPGPLGLECVGRVSRVGAGVALRRGTLVMGLARASLARFAVTDARTVVPVPTGMSVEEAATVPLVFATAYYALCDLSAAQAGQRILIHAATGGVGMAAVQLAQTLGLEIFGTASQGKWPTLQALGVEHIGNSRDLSFASEFRRAASGRGVDIVLNALTGEFVDHSLALVREGGHFLEMGKADIRSPARVREIHPGVEYRAFDLQEAGAERLGEILTELSHMFACGQLRPLPRRVFELTDAEHGFRLMARAGHTGKVVIRMPRTEAASPDRADGRTECVLITGGLGALGLHVAGSLIESRRTGKVVLLGRREPDAAANRKIAGWRTLGASVEVCRCDVTDADELGQLIERVSQAQPITGVIHAAGYLEDQLVPDITEAACRRVLAPKVRGAWNLHELTATMALDYFVLFSSAAASLGSPGQGAYAASNAFLDSLAHMRRNVGLPAQSIAWGPWSGGGMASRLSPRARAQLGATMLAPTDGTALFFAMLRHGERNPIAIAGLTDAVSRGHGGVVPALYAELVAQRSTRAPAARDDLAQRLATLPADERRARIIARLRSEVARVMGFADPESIDSERSLRELGLDSLMLVDLRASITDALGIALATTVVLEHPSVAALADYIDHMLVGVINAAERTDGLDEVSLLVPLSRRSPANAQPQKRPSVFLLPPGTGGVEVYADMAVALSAHADVYAVRAPGSEPGEQPLSAISEHVTRYLPILSATRSPGPYILVGYSAGGVIAYELAQALRPRGEEVGSVVLLDTLPARPESWHPGSAGDHTATEYGHDAWRFCAHIADELGVPGSIAAIVGESGDDIWSAIAGAVAARGLALSVSELKARFSTLRACGHALASYTPRPYSGRGLLIRCSEPAANLLGVPEAELAAYMRTHLDYQWGPLFAEFASYRLPGTHASLLSQNASVIAAIIAGELARIA